MLITCCFLIVAMYMDIFGISVVLPAVACDMSLDTMQQGLLSAIPLIGKWLKRLVNISTVRRFMGTIVSMELHKGVGI
ncbi:hypothetical protein B5X24_HaOG209870 [Helicoverpa armigera]|nr:hypothetical protein B5X24_HaOG209870 [Helicoverpa armigera]